MKMLDLRLVVSVRGLVSEYCAPTICARKVSNPGSSVRGRATEKHVTEVATVCP
jgi:hypothetical protein